LQDCDAGFQPAGCKIVMQASSLPVAGLWCRLPAYRLQDCDAGFQPAGCKIVMQASSLPVARL
jgi:NifU-like protein involved in Fe-S cluster formation